MAATSLPMGEFYQDDHGYCGMRSLYKTMAHIDDHLALFFRDQTQSVRVETKNPFTIFFRDILQQKGHLSSKGYAFVGRIKDFRPETSKKPLSPYLKRIALITQASQKLLPFLHQNLQPNSQISPLMVFPLLDFAIICCVNYEIVYNPSRLLTKQESAAVQEIRDIYTHIGNPEARRWHGRVIYDPPMPYRIHHVAWYPKDNLFFLSFPQDDMRLVQCGVHPDDAFLSQIFDRKPEAIVHRDTVSPTLQALLQQQFQPKQPISQTLAAMICDCCLFGLNSEYTTAYRDRNSHRYLTLLQMYELEQGESQLRQHWESFFFQHGTSLWAASYQFMWAWHMKRQMYREEVQALLHDHQCALMVQDETIGRSHLQAEEPTERWCMYQEWTQSFLLLQRGPQARFQIERTFRYWLDGSESIEKRYVKEKMEGILSFLYRYKRNLLGSSSWEDNYRKHFLYEEPYTDNWADACEEG